MVDERGDVVGAEEYERWVKGAEGKGDGENEGLGEDGKGGLDVGEKVVAGGVVEVENEEAVQAAREVMEPEKQKVAEVGGPRKRKAVRVVGNDIEDTKVVKATTKPVDDTRDSGTTTVTSVASKTSTTAKKIKKVKLSFDEES